MRLTFNYSYMRAVPAEHRSNFIHLNLDIAWFGILNGSTIAFAAVFAARQGASTFQIGLINAIPALITLLLALPAGHWLQKRPLSQGVFLTSILHRWVYLLWIFLPFILSPQVQVWTLIGFILFMSIPGTGLAIGFNALFASAVPTEWRAYLTGTRNAGYALTSILVTLFCGWLLEQLPFPLGYQVVFAIGFVGAAMSSWHLWFIRVPTEEIESSAAKTRIWDWAQPGMVHVWHNVRTAIGLRFLIQRASKPGLGRQFMALNGRFRLILLLLFFAHLTLFLANPLFPIYLVKVAQFNDQAIGLGNSVFYLALFLGSTKLNSVTQRLGHQRTLALGMMFTCFYPGLMALTQELSLFLFTSAAGGFAWSLAGGALGNYVLDETPQEKRSVYLAWYNIALQSGVLLGALLGPILASWLGIITALFLTAVTRFLTGYALWRFKQAVVN